ncbi:MAG: peptidoglycan DD-metalloendopeptidase family protein [Nitrosospira sp.]
MSTSHHAPVTDRGAAASQEIGAEVVEQRPGFYTIQKGDTLYSVARSHGIDQKDLAEWNDIQDVGAIHIGQQLSLSPPYQLTQPSLFSVPEPPLPSTSIASAPNIVPSPQEKPVVSTDRLKAEPKAFKLPYSELAVAQVKGLVGAPPIVVAKADPLIEKNAGAEISPVPPPTESIQNDDRVDWMWPTKGKVLERFTESTKGIDISGKPGQPVTASAAGKVVYSGAGLRGCGKLIIIKHNNTYLSAYAHNNKLLVKEGQTVARGQQIAEMGNSDTNLIKLHFEVRKNGKPVDPLKYLPGISE